MSANVLKKDNVTTILTQREKKRYHQISEQFFRGTGDFFVLYNESINKTVDAEIIKGSFVEHYEDAIQQVKDNIQYKQESLEANSAKNRFYDKLLNFIIILEIGIISSKKVPFEFETISKNMQTVSDEFSYIVYKLKDGTMDGIEYMMDRYGSSFNPVYATDVVLKRIEPFIYYAYENLIYGLDYLFNNNEYNAFLMWLNEMAKVCGTAASGLIGLIMSLFGLGGYTASAKRHNLMHFLRYGTNPYRIAQSYEDEIQKSVETAHDGTSWWQPFSSDAAFGYEWTTGGWEGLDDDDDGNELPEVKKLLNRFQESRVIAAAQSNEKYRKDSIFGAPDIFGTTGYEEMESLWHTLTVEEKTKTYDLGGVSSIFFEQILVNAKLTSTEQLASALSKVGNFYTRNKNDNPHPYAKRICAEIEKYDLLNYKQKDRKDEKSGHYTIEQFIFIPVVLYAIMQYEHTQKRDLELIRMYDLNMKQNDILLTVRKQSYGSEQYKKILYDYKNGIVTSEDVIKKLVKLLYFREPLFNLKNISYEDIFSSFTDFYDAIVNAKRYATKSLSYLVYGTSGDYYDFRSLTTSSKNENGATVYEEEESVKVNWKTVDVMLLDIKTNYTYLKNNIRDLYNRRKELFEYFCKIVGKLEPKVLYPGLDKY